MTFFKNWREFFEIVRHRPKTHLGEKSLRALMCVIGGFRTAEEFYEVPAEKRASDFDFEAFEEFIAKKVRSCSYGSPFLAREATQSEEEAFDLWFQWVDEYVAITSTKPAAVEAEMEPQINADERRSNT